MPAKQISINLIGEEEMEHTPVGRIVTWAITYGRYIMIGTEIVVLLAFISRFSLDRKLTDLKDEISQKQELIEANTETTVYFEQLQQLFTGIKDLLTTTQNISRKSANYWAKTLNISNQQVLCLQKPYHQQPFKV